MAKRKVLALMGGNYHPFMECGAILKTFVEATGRYAVAVTEDRNALKAGPIGKYDVVLAYTDGGQLTGEQLKGLTGFVKKGGAFVGLHGAAASWLDSAEYHDMLGSTFAGHGPVMDFPVSITAASSLITRRIQTFRVEDELYLLKRFDPKAVEVLATAYWEGKPQPIAYTKSYGAGRVFFLGLGHDQRTFHHPEFQKMVVRGLDWGLGRRERAPLTCGAIGYGASFNMGRLHLETLRDAAGFDSIAVCDIDPARRKAAEEENPGIKTYASVTQMLKASDVELLVVITPHNSHAPIALQCLNAGRHVVTEKPFCVTVKEADAMIAASRKRRRMLSVFHNRRWDGDYMAIKDIIARGLLGDVFQIELCGGSYGHPSYWWRSHKPIAGGAFYDWGAHFVDWVLGIMPAPVTEVSGHFQMKKVWHDVTTEDHCNAMLRFANGACANIELSNLAALTKRRWRILGTKGALEDKDEKHFRLVSYANGIRQDSEVPHLAWDWKAYYRNVADHLLLGEPLVVTPESARRVIQVIEMAEQSSRAKKALPIKGR